MTVKTLELTRTYRLGPSFITAISRVNLEIEESLFVSIVGPSGSGKTTLLNLIGMNDQPTSGKVFLRRMDTTLLSERQRRQMRLKSIGFVFQTFNLLPILTALENVELPMSLIGLSQSQQRERAISLLESVGLSERVNHRPKQMSTGEMQRAAIARALANDPWLILADEPTGELDSETGKEIVELLLEMCRQQNKTVIVATHDEKITKVADMVYRIENKSMERKK